MDLTGAAMKTGSVLALFPVLTLLAGCMSDAEFAVRLASISDRTEAAAAAAHRCADELRAVTDRVPFVIGAALEMQNGMSPALGSPPMPASVVARRALEELARRERAIEGARRAIRSAQDVGPAALENAVEAEQLAHGARDRVCQARDVATTVVAMMDHRGPREGVATAVK